MSKDRYQIWVSQIHETIDRTSSIAIRSGGQLGDVFRGWLSQACDELIDDRGDPEAGVFSMEELTAILPTLSYEGCVLDEVRIENTHQPGEES